METQREPKSWAMIAISGPNVKSAEISAKLGMEADYCHDSDTTDVHNKPLIAHWQINSTLSPDSPVNDHIWELLKRLAPARKSMKELAPLHETCLYASVEFASPETKGIRLDKRTMLLLGELGLDLEIQPWQGKDTKPLS